MIKFQLTITNYTTVVELQTFYCISHKDKEKKKKKKKKRERDREREREKEKRCLNGFIHLNILTAMWKASLFTNNNSFGFNRTEYPMII